MPSELLEDSAVERLRTDGVRALSDLFVQERDRLKRLVERRLDRRLVTRLDASDVVQDAFVRASKQLNDYLDSPQMAPHAWLRVMTRRTVYDIHERHRDAQKRDPAAEASPLLIEDLSTSLRRPDSDVALAELHRRINDQVTSMSENDRIVLTLRHVDELSIREIAEELGLAMDTAKKRYVRAIRRLRAACDKLNPNAGNEE